MIADSRGTTPFRHNSSHRQQEHAQALHRFQPDNVLALTRGDGHKFSFLGKGLFTVYLLGKENQLV